MTSPQPDTELTAADRAQTFIDWTRINARALTTGALIVAVAGVGFWFYTRSREIKIVNADRALLSARESMDKGNLPLAASDLGKVVDRYASTPAGVQAAMLLAQLDYDQKKYQE